MGEFYIRRLLKFVGPFFLFFQSVNHLLGDGNDAGVRLCKTVSLLTVPHLPQRQTG